MSFLGEQGHTLLIEQQKSQHQDRNKRHQKYIGSAAFPSSSIASQQRQGSLHSLSELVEEGRSFLLPSASSLSSFVRLQTYGSTVSDTTTTSPTSPESGTASPNAAVNTIRFQVVIWNIGKLDVVAGTVPMTFRVSLFWNDMAMTTMDSNHNNDELLMNGADESSTVSSVNSMHVWKMHGRQRAFQQELKDVPIKAIEVPPLAIMNVSTFETIGSPDVDMLSENTRLMRWSAMYRATVVQEDLRVDEFPHDDHAIALKLAILSHRGKGKTWDRRYWRLALATNEDTQHSTRIPHGLIVDQARLPGFSYNRERGLDFTFCELNHGVFDQHQPGEIPDTFLKVSLHVLRDSGYHDWNILPILALMNVVAVSVLAFEDTEFFYRALITLNIAFVQMGIRMTSDNHLPNVEYEIRLQRILNEFFVVLMMLVLEAMAVYVLRTYYKASSHVTKTMDWITGFLAVAHNAFTTIRYYRSKQKAKKRLEKGWRNRGSSDEKGL